MLKDVLGSSGLELMAIIALVIFFVVFIAITARVMTRPKKDMDQQAQIPMDENHVVEPRDEKD